MRQYRRLTVKEARETTPPGGQLLIDFVDCIVGFTATKAWLAEHGITVLRPGDDVLVIGKDGNSDMQLWRMDALEDMRLASDFGAARTP